MFLILLTIVSLVTVLLFGKITSSKRDGNLPKVIAGACLVFSWITIVMWFTSLLETWQIGLNTPGAGGESIPAWNRTVLNSLRTVAFLLPTSRFTLGVLYALPLLLIPLASTVASRSQAMLPLTFSTLGNLIFFWVQVIVDSGLATSFVKLSIQGVILLLAYFFLVLALLLQRPLSSFLATFRGVDGRATR